MKRQGEIEKAREQYEAAYYSNIVTFGEFHPVTASDAINLGNIMVCQGQAGDAHPFYQQAADVRQAFFGSEHPLTKEAEKLMKDTTQAYEDAMESGPSIVHRKCF